MNVKEPNSNDLLRIASVTGKLASYLPEPATKSGRVFGDVVNVVRSIGNAVVGGVPASASGDFAALIELQLAAQREMQSTTMVSNIERSKHESKMAAIRNIRMS